MKKLIEKFVHFIFSSPKTRNNTLLFWFGRLLAELVSDEKKRSSVLGSIADWFQTKKEIFPFNDIFVVGDVVYIWTKTPAYWIGKGGSLVNDLSKTINNNAMGRKIYNFDIHFVENLGSAANTISSYIRIMYDSMGGQVI